MEKIEEEEQHRLLQRQDNMTSSADNRSMQQTVSDGGLKDTLSPEIREGTQSVTLSMAAMLWRKRCKNHDRDVSDKAIQDATVLAARLEVN